ncbi:hypothetical protein HNR46_002732 [Haloferula luteola]|uniref:Uncharacterized protein n=1 Tax=Haloferula luteola TaxID=595692 RepID=A0A840V633_9BACT|nr:hypothetical protein [Haloferula luteola]MBB5352486.1 hypothetical protein [Haloferula luteola]
MKFLRRLLIATALVATALAQNTDKLVVTSGTSYEREGRTHAYITWQPGDITTTLGMRFGIYRKDGGIASANPYQRAGITVLQGNPETVRALLELGAKVDFNAPALIQRITGIYRDTVTGSELNNGPDEPLGAASKLSYLISAATEDPPLLNQLLLLGRAHPGVMLALGHAFVIPMPEATTQTFEVRELNSADQDVRVIGRVELDPTAPVFPPPPGPPVQVLHELTQGTYVHSAKDHLNARLRWGQDADLRRAMPATFGFDLFRVSEDFATTLGWDATPPSRDELLDLWIGGSPPPTADLARVNTLPIMIDPPLTLAEAADPTDRENFYCADDNGLAQGGQPFEDGATFYYFVAARDLCGRPGHLSPGTRVVMCDRQPPLPPQILSVENVFDGVASASDWDTLNGQQHLKVRIRQLDNANSEEAASRYHVYRWAHAREPLRDGADPMSHHVGVVDHMPDQEFVDFHDIGSGAPSLPDDASITYWYTVRAEDNTSCVEKNYSAHSSPVYGVLRDRAGPGAPTGTVEVCRYRAALEPLGPQRVRFADYGIDDPREVFGVRVARDSPAVKGARVELRTADGSALETRMLVFSDEDFVDSLFERPEKSGLSLCVQVVTSTGIWSNFVCSSIQGETIKEAFNLYAFATFTRRDCKDSRPGGVDIEDHDAVLIDGTIQGVSGTITLPPTTAEWRVYRRVDLSGPLTLIAKAEGDSLPSPAPWIDEALPAEADAIVCYYFQAFDEHNNPSPLVRVACVRLKRDHLPQPMLAEVALQTGTVGEAQAKLTWFCDPVGVQRFELFVASETSNDPGIEGQAISGPLGGPEATLVLDGEFDGRAVAVHQTRQVGSPSFLPGPEFTTVVNIPTGQKLFFALRAVGDGAFGARSAGDLSNQVETTWITPDDEPQPVIPWPARPLPSVQKTGIDILDYTEGEGPYLATRLPSLLEAAGGIVMGAYKRAYEFDSKGSVGYMDLDPPPLEKLFRFRAQGGPSTSDLRPLAPFVVYRYQVPNSTFPEAVPNLVQVSPRIDRMAYLTGNVGGQNIATVRDPFFRYPSLRSSSVPIAVAGKYGPNEQPVVMPAESASNVLPPYLENREGLIVWVDPMPYIRDASYRYLIVCFDPDHGEISRVIPTNIVNP